MRSLLIVSPAPPGSSLGNAVTAERYARIFRALGYRVAIATAFDKRRPVDILVALHAHKSARSVLRFATECPGRPIVLVLTGTDVYRDVRRSRISQLALETADVLVTLQPDAVHQLPKHVRCKTYSIVQSAKFIKHRAQPGNSLHVCVLGHLRYEKDPLRTAYALEKIPAGVPILLTQAGAALTTRYATSARLIEQRESRYRYLGEVSPARARSILASSDLMVLSSRIEGGANVASEAIAAGTPMLASRISGNIGILGKRYPGLFATGDTTELARLLARAARDPEYVTRLRTWCEHLRPMVTEQSERDGWRRLLASFGNGIATR